MRVIVLSAAFAALCLPTWAADDVNPADIIRRFAAKELEFQQAFNNYSYRQSVKIEELDAARFYPTGGKWLELDWRVFSRSGKRAEIVVMPPAVSLEHLQLTPQDVQDLREMPPFVLTSADLGDYNVAYLGRQSYRVNFYSGSFPVTNHSTGSEVDMKCYSFSVKPKRMVKDKRYFEGEILVDASDPQIVKTSGKDVGVVSWKFQSASFQTYREQIDGKYWFPNRTEARVTLPVTGGKSQLIRASVQYGDYQQYDGKAIYGGVADDTNPGTTPPPAKKQ